MPCTTLLVGKNASYDGSTIVARNEDAPSGEFTPKKFAVVSRSEQPRLYKSVVSHVEIELPDDPLAYTCLPDAVPTQGIWAAAGVNEANVSMSATETLTTNVRVLGADPLVELRPARGVEGDEGYEPEVVGGIGEEDMVTLVLPYIRSAREGVARLGGLLERYGTYEMNGIAFSDVDEIWWLETVGGHHWIAKRVPDDAYVVMPNQLGIDSFDLDDALGEGQDHLCSADLAQFMAHAHLDLDFHGELEGRVFNPRLAFGSHDDSDHVYNTPRAWDIQRKLSPGVWSWYGEDPDFGPESDDIPWAARPEHKITVEDVKYALSMHFQGTPYDPYDRRAPESSRGKYRPIGVNRNCQLSVAQLRPYAPQATRAVQWIAFGCNVFNALVPLYANVGRAPDYLGNATNDVNTNSFYWANRLIAAMADAHFTTCEVHVERYQLKFGGFAHALLARTDALVAERGLDAAGAREVLERANDEMCDELREQTGDLLGKVLYTSSMGMKNSYARSDG